MRPHDGRIRKDYGVLGPYQKNMRAALELMSGAAQAADSSAKMSSWTVGKVLISAVGSLLF